MPDGTIEIFTGRERRRRWGITEKLAIVSESQEPGACVADVAARHDIFPSLLHGWRRLARQGRLNASGPSGFVPVRLMSSLAEFRPRRLLVHPPMTWRPPRSRLSFRRVGGF